MCTVNETTSGLTNSPTLEWVDELGMPVSGDDVTVENTTMTENSATQTLTFTGISTSRGEMYMCTAILMSPAVDSGITNSSTVSVNVQSE